MYRERGCALAPTEREDEKGRTARYEPQRFGAARRRKRMPLTGASEMGDPLIRPPSHFIDLLLGIVSFDQEVGALAQRWDQVLHSSSWLPNNRRRSLRTLSSSATSAMSIERCCEKT